jgi:hypothetical protein
MKKTNTNHRPKKVPAVALEILRGEPGSFARVRRRLAVSKAYVSMVANGQKRSDRVRHALLREARRIAIRRGYERAIEIDEYARR